MIVEVINTTPMGKKFIEGTAEVIAMISISHLVSGMFYCTVKFDDGDVADRHTNMVALRCCDCDEPLKNDFEHGPIIDCYGGVDGYICNDCNDERIYQVELSREEGI